MNALAHTAIPADGRYADVASMPIEAIDLTCPRLFHDDNHEAVFDRLRAEDPVHLQHGSDSGAFWSVTRYDDAMAVDTNHKVFSSRDISLVEDMPEGFDISMFLAMDPPRHTAYREALKPLFSAIHVATLEDGIRARTRAILDELPVGETFDWVERVSIELTSFVLSTLFDFPFEERHRLIEWSDRAVLKNAREDGASLRWEDRQADLMECLREFTRIKDERAGGDRSDLVSVLAHGHGQKFLRPSEFLGNILLMIVAGNDTTRNSITGGVVALNRFPDEYRRLRDDRSLLAGAVAETFRWQSPVAYMRRTAAFDTQLGGKRIRAGEKVLIWYASGNRDASVFDDPHAFRIDRKNVAKHLSFGFGVHRCIGLRLADLQLRVLWEELLDRFDAVETVGEPTYTPSTFIKGYSHLPVRLHRRTKR
ncbi:cytochrome P450 [Tahibacter soli]|uniref:Cytochrome P450 n=1 Tax=Tahibacter soli TaxID=2983605 RepID=A0A9X4BJB0_9GAMM|nr:cytochrome P450 [Tahibacter soli]MDC8016155.1 cytochrome P450 [Tahibacter soli]